MSTVSTMNTAPVSAYRQSTAYYHPTPSSSLTQPIAIPATTSTLGSPFLRAYPIELEAFGIPTSDFLSFLDELNRLMVVSPPVRVLGLAGNIVGFVPSATAQIVGGAVNAAATLTQYGMSKGRSELFIRESNEKLFGPRGLKVNIVKVEVVARVASIPILNADGKVAKDANFLTHGTCALDQPPRAISLGARVCAKEHDRQHARLCFRTSTRQRREKDAEEAHKSP
jgi:hypothetical protein